MRVFVPGDAGCAELLLLLLRDTLDDLVDDALLREMLDGALTLGVLWLGSVRVWLVGAVRVEKLRYDEPPLTLSRFPFRPPAVVPNLAEVVVEFLPPLNTYLLLSPSWREGVAGVASPPSCL